MNGAAREIKVFGSSAFKYDVATPRPGGGRRAFIKSMKKYKPTAETMLPSCGMNCC